MRSVGRIGSELGDYRLCIFELHRFHIITCELMVPTGFKNVTFIELAPGLLAPVGVDLQINRIVGRQEHGRQLFVARIN